ncbi:MAG: hypothetical protein ACOX41_05855 [Anaerovoracaceae bacterium]|jgi:hypothetical protein
MSRKISALCLAITLVGIAGLFVLLLFTRLGSRLQIDFGVILLAVETLLLLALLRVLRRGECAWLSAKNEAELRRFGAVLLICCLFACLLPSVAHSVLTTRLCRILGTIGLLGSMIEGMRLLQLGQKQNGSV